MIETQVLVIGGGATGVGVARDAVLRGLHVVLVERRDLAEGTTGRFHGLLHSGARYAVRDPQSARECIGENRVQRRIAGGCIEDTGGLFVCTPADDPAFGDRFGAACADAGIEAEEIGPGEALRREPRLNPASPAPSRCPTPPSTPGGWWGRARTTSSGAAGPSCATTMLQA